MKHELKRHIKSSIDLYARLQNHELFLSIHKMLVKIDHMNSQQLGLTVQGLLKIQQPDLQDE